MEAMPPFLGGGHMIADVRLDGFTPAELPAKFEAGTPPIAEAVGFGAAIDYLTELGMANVRAHEMNLTRYAIDTLTGPLRRRHHDPRPRQRRGARRHPVASPSATSTPTTSARCSTSPTCACGPATTAPSR